MRPCCMSFLNFSWAKRVKGSAGSSSLFQIWLPLEQTTTPFVMPAVKIQLGRGAQGEVALRPDMGST